MGRIDLLESIDRGLAKAGNLLLERPHVSTKTVIKLPTSTGKIVPIDLIDIRLEDMMQDGLKLPKTQDPIYHWFALVVGDEYLTGDGDVVADPKVLEDNGYWRLPDNWWQYAVGYYNNKNTKASIRPRFDQGEKSQEELDTETSVDAESYERRLDGVLS